MSTPKFYTNRNRLTAYAFACGYIESYSNALHDVVTLNNEHGVYHVKELDHTGHQIWRSFATLTAARADFASRKRVLRGLTE